MRKLFGLILLLSVFTPSGAMDMVDSLLMVHANDSSILALGTVTDYSVPEWAVNINRRKIVADSVSRHDRSLAGRIKDVRRRIHERMNEPYDTVHDSGYWRRALRHGKFGIINDPTVKFPGFLNFIAKVYRWGDKTFNSYDTTYVKPTGKNFKFMFKANNWFDNYVATLDGVPGRFAVNGQVATNIGFRFSFMAVGFEYMPDLDNLLFGEPIKHRKTRFSFTCSRIHAEVYYHKNEGLSRIHRFSDYNGGDWLNMKYNGLSRKTLGLDAFYFFNYMKYAHAAAYCFSKYQRRSAGSFVLGIQYTNQQTRFDFTVLPDDMRQILPRELSNEISFHYYDYGINVGYAYNCVMPHNWLFNIMATPSFGIRHGASSNVNGSSNTVLLDLRLRLAFVYNCKKFFYSFNGSANTNWYHGNGNHMFNSLFDFTLLAGIRF